MRERQADRVARASVILRRLEEDLPEARIALAHANPLELLVAVVLSAQCTDERVNAATPALFARYRTAADYARAAPEELEPYLRTLGLFRNKAKSLVGLGRALVERHGGEVPRDRASLAELPGAGNKTAGVVSMELGGQEALPVDTHLARLAWRMRLSSETHPDKIERDLERLWPASAWGRAHHLFIWHGRKTCTARSPACERCVVADLCPKRGVR